jgi:hypothetical protein
MERVEGFWSDGVRIKKANGEESERLRAPGFTSVNAFAVTYCRLDGAG